MQFKAVPTDILATTMQLCRIIILILIVTLLISILLIIILIVTMVGIAWANDQFMLKLEYVERCKNGEAGIFHLAKFVICSGWYI